MPYHGSNAMLPATARAIQDEYQGHEELWALVGRQHDKLRLFVNNDRRANPTRRKLAIGQRVFLRGQPGYVLYHGTRYVFDAHNTDQLLYRDTCYSIMLDNGYLRRVQSGLHVVPA